MTDKRSAERADREAVFNPRVTDVGYYDRQGRPVPLEMWATMLENIGERIVAKTTVGVSEVSTVWIGIDASYGHGPHPLIFETMVFGGALNEETDRYATEAEALAGHQAMCERVGAS